MTVDPRLVDPRLDELVAHIRRSRKYADVGEALVRRIGARELAKGRTINAAVKATKNKLHQVGGLYFAAPPRYADWLRQIVAAPDDAARRATLRRIMAHHTSTRERLPILEAFYARLFAEIGPVRSVLDLACGLNPLSLPWMPLAPAATYHAVDIYAELMRFVQSVFDVLGVSGRAEVGDISAECPGEHADVALLLKALPCLEQLDPSAVPRIMDTIKARHIVVSFPTHTVGGRDVGMRDSYAARFETLAAGRGWQARRLEFASELVYVIGPLAGPLAGDETL